MLLALPVTLISGAATLVTVRLAVLLAAPAAGTWVVVTPLVVLGLVPTVLLVTNTVTVQLPLAGTVIPLKARAVAALVKLLVPAPRHVPPAAWLPLIAMLTSVSVKLAFVRLLALAFVNVKVIVLVPPEAIEAGAKPLAIVGATGVRLTVRLAVLLTAPAAGTCVVVTPLVELGFVPTVLR